MAQVKYEDCLLISEQKKIIGLHKLHYLTNLHMVDRGYLWPPGVKKVGFVLLGSVQ